MLYILNQIKLISAGKNIQEIANEMMIWDKSSFYDLFIPSHNWGILRRDFVSPPSLVCTFDGIV